MARKRILIIEDDALFAAIYTTNFVDAGFEVIVATDGNTGLERIRKDKPDLVILDLMLPKVSGFEILDTLRHAKDPHLKKLPSLVVTNLDQHAEEERAMKLGAKGYFVKANTIFSSVLERVKDLIDGGR